MTMTKTDESPKQPSVRQGKVLEAYFESGNAAAVHRATGVSERQVRRIVKDFAWLLEEWQTERDAEHHARVLAREARIQDWKDKKLGHWLDVIDEVADGPNPGQRLRAVSLGMSLGQSSSAMPVPPGEVESAALAKERELAERLRLLKPIDETGLADG